MYSASPTPTAASQPLVLISAPTRNPRPEKLCPWALAPKGSGEQEVLQSQSHSRGSCAQVSTATPHASVGDQDRGAGASPTLPGVCARERGQARLLPEMGGDAGASRTWGLLLGIGSGATGGEGLPLSRSYHQGRGLEPRGGLPHPAMAAVWGGPLGGSSPAPQLGLQASTAWWWIFSRAPQ